MSLVGSQVGGVSSNLLVVITECLAHLMNCNNCYLISLVNVYAVSVLLSFWLCASYHGNYIIPGLSVCVLRIHQYGSHLLIWSTNIVARTLHERDPGQALDGFCGNQHISTMACWKRACISKCLLQEQSRCSVQLLFQIEQPIEIFHQLSYE